jgi:hypothetical protein
VALRLVLALGSALIAGGCVGGMDRGRPDGDNVEPAPVGVVTHRSLGGGPAAIVQGVMVVEGGCVAMRTDAGLAIPSWPAGTRAWIVEGRVVLADQDGRVRLTEGEQGTFGGGYDYGIDFMKELADVPVPPACDLPGDYLLINRLEQVNPG